MGRDSRREDWGLREKVGSGSRGVFVMAPRPSSDTITGKQLTGGFPFVGTIPTTVV